MPTSMQQHLTSNLASASTNFDDIVCHSAVTQTLVSESFFVNSSNSKHNLFKFCTYAYIDTLNGVIYVRVV